ncbi:MAG: type I DNA topoisomerase [Caldicoprobacterales bacterium]|nr:type I DNA topoisomerase [Clostridiales bacterium]
MAQNLVIVESPAKARTIKKFLGRNYKVEASMGHVRDLPKSQLGVDIDNDFEPKYITIRGKGEILKKLRKEAQSASQVFLATDPDREGEAISWHLAHALKIDANSSCRIEFNEITKTAVKEAIKKPRPINKNLVDAQQARRVLDRIVGYQISPLLWRKIRKGLSAGRVQSVATRIICEREREIQNFIPEEYWTLVGNFHKTGHTQIFEANFYGRNGKKVELKNQQQVETIIKELNGTDFVVDEVKKGIKKRNPSPPFTTSTLQQEASRKLGFTAQKTMMLAQQLYEGIDIEGEGSVGLITYIRTDSTRISNDAQQEALNYILSKYGKDYRPDKPNVFRGKKGAQDAHEAIRPTSILRDPELIKNSLKRDQYRLYKLIYQRFLASQMTPAVFETMTITIKGKEYVFRATGSRKIFQGYSVLYEEGRDDAQEEKDIDLPEVESGEKLVLKALVPNQHFTQPPPRYTEASLVRTLEEMGIGRPSTYAPTIHTITTRGYVERDKRTLIPTELGFIVNALMTEYFSDIVDYEFTADMEEVLDKVEEGEKYWKDIIREFYPSFKKLLDYADGQIPQIEIKEEESDVICEKCGVNMVIKTGRYGKFLACPNFPECRNTKPLLEELDVPCPKCGSNIVTRKTKRGRKFYGCSQYPECDFVSWDPPVKESCPKCGEFMVEKNYRGTKTISCSNNDCKYKMKKEMSR